MSESDDGQNTRPISVAELLARNGTIGAPPAGGRRRRRRGNADAISVAELTGEIPIIRDEPPAEVPVEPPVEVAEVADEPVVVADDVDEPVEEVEPEAGVEPEVGVEPEAEVEPEADVGESVEPQADADEEVPEEDEEAEELAEAEDVAEGIAEDVAEAEHAEAAEEQEAAEAEAAEVIENPASGAEQMAPDPVDDSVDLDELLADHEHETEALRSYLQDSSGALFSGGTIADDIARRGGAESESTSAGAVDTPLKDRPESRPQGRLGGFRAALVAVFQSVLAVVFGAGLFLAFDQLWRWNTIVALVLSVLVILGLVIAVRVVRKTEDITSTLIAVAVGALVTLGPLALLQST